MDIHKNARLTPHSRAELVRRVLDQGQTPKAVAAAFGVCPRTVRKWVSRYRTEGVEGLVDRSSRPHSSPRRTGPEVAGAIEALRRQRRTGQQIAASLGVSPATVSRVLRRLGLNRLRDLDPAEPVRRYERAAPGDMIHIDIKKLGRFTRVGHRITGDRTGQSRNRGKRGGKTYGVGWEYVHVAIDDHSRIAFAQVMPDEKKESAIAFLQTALAYYRSLGVAVQRVMTDNGSCYKALAFRDLCLQRGLKHIRTRPYTPKTNGKAERFIQTSLRVYRNDAHGRWVEALLAGDIETASAIARKMERPPAFITRDLDTLKSWLHARQRGEQRVGLLASSGAVRLIAAGVPPSPKSNELSDIVHWFLRPTGDYRSSNALEVPLSEFVCQGLEVDYVGLCWGNDLIWEDDAWVPRQMRAPRWKVSRKDEARQYRLNAYRVLLTRARAGLAIFVPQGDAKDESQQPQDFNPTFSTLQQAGARVLNEMKA